MTKTLSILILISVGCLAQVVKAQPSLTGIVVDHSGKAAPGALVQYGGYPLVSISGSPPEYAKFPIAGTVSAAADGTFSITGIPLGRFQVCAFGVGPGQLPSCYFGLPLTEVSLTQPSPMSAGAIALGDGIYISITVNDPANAIVDMGGPDGAGLALQGGNFQVGVFAGTWYTPARVATVASGRRVYGVTVPRSPNAVLVIDSSLTVSAGGAARSGDALIRVPFDSGTVQTFTAQVAP